MASVCISNCVNDVRLPERATYVRIKKWPESAADYSRRTADSNVRRPGTGYSRVVDVRSCRQMYLRSYTFTRKETLPEKTKKCMDRVREKVTVAKGRRRKGKSRQPYAAARRVKKSACAAMCAFFRRVLFCTASVDAVER